MQNTWPRALSALALSVLVLWLYFDESAGNRRIKALDKALAARTIGRLTDAQDRRLESTVEEALDALDIKIKVAVDQPYHAGILNVYTTSAPAEWVTRCSAGNALYDPELDAIFIDEQFFSDAGYRGIYENSDYSAMMDFKSPLVFPEIFLRFVLLHELGHRQLHRHIKDYRPDVSKRTLVDLRKLEREADAFALTGMKKFYALDRSRGNPLVGAPLREAVGLSDFFDPDIAPATQVYVDLVGSLFMMANMNLYLGTPYSPFFESNSHPTFLDRARGAIRAVIADQGLDSKIRANFSFLQESLAREADVGHSTFTEVLVPDTVNDVSFAHESLLILGAGNSNLYQVPTAKIATAISPFGHPVVAAEPIGDKAKAIKPRPNEGFWSRPDRSAIVIDAEGYTWRYADGHRTSYQLPLPAPLTTHGCFRLSTPPQPTERAVVEACAPDFDNWLVSIRQDTVTAKRRKADILKEIVTKIGVTVDDLVMVGIDDQYFYAALMIEKPEQRLVGSAAVSLQSLTLSDVTLFKGEASLLGHQTGQDRVWPLVVMPANGGFTRNFLIANRPASDLVISAWSVTATQPPIAVAKQDLLIRHVNGDATPDLIADFDPYVTNTWSLTETMSLISFANDSLYLFDARKGTIDVAFHPIFEGMDVRIGRGGHWAIFLRGGSRVFLFDSYRTE